MCYFGILSCIGLVQVIASLILVASVYVQYDICYVSNSVYSLIWIQTVLSIGLYIMHCIPGLYMILKAIKLKLVLFVSQMILTIITAVMLDFNDLTKITCNPQIYGVMIYSSVTIAVSAFLSAMYVLYKEPTKNKEVGYENSNALNDDV